MTTLLNLDRSLTDQFYDLIWANSAMQQLTHFLATYLIYFLPLMLLYFFFLNKKRLVATKVFFGVILTWKVYSSLIGTFFYTFYGFRDRPFASKGIAELFFEQPHKAFPSDHAAVLMFLTLILFEYRQSRWAQLFLVLTILSTLARVGIGFHYFGDIAGGLLVGYLGYLTIKYLDGIIDKYLTRINWLKSNDEQPS